MRIPTLEDTRKALELFGQTHDRIMEISLTAVSRRQPIEPILAASDASD